MQIYTTMHGYHYDGSPNKRINRPNPDFDSKSSEEKFQIQNEPRCPKPVFSVGVAYDKELYAQEVHGNKFKANGSCGVQLR